MLVSSPLRFIPRVCIWSKGACIFSFLLLFWLSFLWSLFSSSSSLCATLLYPHSNPCWPFPSFFSSPLSLASSSFTLQRLIPLLIAFSLSPFLIPQGRGLTRSPDRTCFISAILQIRLTSPEASYWHLMLGRHSHLPPSAAWALCFCFFLAHAKCELLWVYLLVISTIEEYIFLGRTREII